MISKINFDRLEHFPMVLVEIEQQVYETVPGFGSLRKIFTIYSSVKLILKRRFTNWLNSKVCNMGYDIGKHTVIMHMRHKIYCPTENLNRM